MWRTAAASGSLADEVELRQMRFNMDASASSQVVPGKACGTCMMCCKVLHIKELEKPAGVWCRHAVARKGCGIYPERPPICQDFYCQWMRSPDLGPEWKPDKAKFVIYFQPDMALLHVNVDPNFPKAWTKPPFYPAIKRWAIDAAERRQFVLVRIGAHLIAVLPDRDVDMGQVDPAARLIVSRRQGPAGFIYEVEVGHGEAPQGTEQIV